MNKTMTLLVLWAATLAPSGWAATEYTAGSPTLQDIWIDPVNGHDGNGGSHRTSPLKTLMAAWNRIPASSTLTDTGYRIRLMPGTLPCEPGPEMDNCQNDLASRWGSLAFPVIIEAADGPGTVTVRGGLNLRDLRYFYLRDLNLVAGGSLPTNASGNNLLHIEGGHHILLRGLSLTGPACDSDACNNLQEVLKVNQTQHLYVENCSIGGAWHSSVDYFAVQYGHFIGNRIHTAGQWGMYVKGGSANLTIEGNLFTGTQLGFQAGQSANFAMMRSPWLHYEAYDISFVNNVLRDIAGVGVSVAGGYNVLIAHNTLYNVATSTEPGYPLMSFVHGERNCTPTDELPNPVPQCEANAAAGGWGPVIVAEGQPVIPNRRVLVLNNLLYNPDGRQSRYSHFTINRPAAVPNGFLNIPEPSGTDDQLTFAGNVIWNGGADMPTGVGEAACLQTNATCNLTQVLANNHVNTLRPQLVDPAQGNYRPAAASTTVALASVPIPDFQWNDAPQRPTVPPGTTTQALTHDHDQLVRASRTPPGAYTTSDSLNSAQWFAGLDCLFDWAQDHFTDWFSPPAQSHRLEPYYFRYYAQSQNYLGGRRDDQHIVVLGGNGRLTDLGPVQALLGASACRRG